MARNSNESVGSLRQRSKRSLNDQAHELVATLFTPLAKWLQQMGVSANTVTLFGFIFNLLAGGVLVMGKIQLAAILITVGGLLDGLDGLLARVSAQVSPFGAFFDSVLDRWSEIVVFLGLLLWYQRAGLPVEVVLIYIAMASSLLVSYTRARAEGVGAQCKRGLFTRLERVVVLVAGLVLQQVTIALWILAVFATITALQRIYFTWKYIKGNAIN
ncbi:MAG: CDP-alcohol phosphatidyltransferase family protein [Anaerolineae bacterium]|nr:CDP-alcohol phosphatidyltransferase family protein [Anaerolineae bacterium]